MVNKHLNGGYEVNLDTKPDEVVFITKNDKKFVYAALKAQIG